MKDLNYSAESEIDRAFGVLESMSKDIEDISSSLSVNSATSEQPVLTMSSLGKLGRFGNQLFQYAFLKICAKRSNSQVECPPWIGQTLFGHKDPPISCLLPPAVENRELGESLFDVIPEFIPYIEKLAGAKSSRIGAEALADGLENVNLYGFFQIHTRFLEPHKDYFRSLFQPVSDLQSVLEEGLNLLRSKGKTIIGIHIRRGDFITVPQAGFTLVVPSRWWCNWLDEVWGEVEDPVLFLCSDDLDSIIHDFEKFCPVTSRDLYIKLPERMEGLDVEFYIDFFILSKCDMVGISNSIFSFAACMLNEQSKTFIRPHWNFTTKLTIFDPWNSEPLLYIGGNQPKIIKSLIDILRITYITQGFFGAIKSVCIYYPKELIKGLIIRAYLGYQVEGVIGIIKSLLYILGWHSIWNKIN